MVLFIAFASLSLVADVEAAVAGIEGIREENEGTNGVPRAPLDENGRGLILGGWLWNSLSEKVGLF